MLEMLHSYRFIDQTPAPVVAILLDEGHYLCSPPTKCRISADVQRVRERRDQRRHPLYTKPELVACGPNEVWPWYITLLCTYVKWQHLHLGVFLALFSRYVLSWLLAESATTALTQQLITECIEREHILPGQLAVHVGRGTQMVPSSHGQFYAKADIVSSHRRSRFSDDNPFSESQFKTTESHASLPGRFSGLDHGLDWGREFSVWYKHEYLHSGVAYLAPAQVQTGQTEQLLHLRERTVMRVWEAHPERFVHGPPRVLRPPSEVWINLPKSLQTTVRVGLEGTQRFVTNSERQVSQSC